MKTLTTTWEQVVLEGDRPEICVDDMARLLLDPADPFCEFFGVGDCGRKESKFNFLTKQNNGFFPDNTPFFISHVMHLIEDDPSYFSANF